MKNTFITTKIYTELEQIISIEPNEGFDGVVLKLVESDKSSCFRLYLTYKEAFDLANEILKFVSDKDINK